MKQLYIFTVKHNDVEKKVFLKKPGSEVLNLINLKYSAELGKAMSMGVLSHEDMRRILQDQGGLRHSKSDRTNRNLLVQEITKAENKYHQLKIDGKDLNKATIKVKDLYDELAALDLRLTKIFGNSAEAIADTRALVWTTTELAFWDADKSKIFNGETDDDKVSAYYSAIDDDGIEKIAAEQAFLFIQGFLLGRLVEEEDFKNFEMQLNGIPLVEESVS